tara:strand:- start:1640 stop:2371 length:732 start_codon:yes stop_codon:yes gene_type:complete
MFIENVLKLSGMVFKKQQDLKEPKYSKLKIWNTGWETIDIGSPPTGNAVVKEIEQISREFKNASDEQKEQYINCDEDASYYIKQYMDENDLDYDEDTCEFIEKQCSPIIRHYKNFYNRPRPYQVAEALGMEFDRFVSDTSKTPAYPSGHTVQPIVVAEYFAKLYPQHRAGLMKGAKICGYGRVLAGMHYPSDYDAGVKLGEELIDFLNMDLVEDAPVNATGAGISMPPTMKKKKKKDDLLKRF